MPLISASAALLVVLTRPAATGPPRQEAQQATPKDTTKKKKDDEPKGAQKPKTEYPFFRVDDHPSIHFGKGSHLDFRARFAADGMMVS